MTLVSIGSFLGTCDEWINRSYTRLTIFLLCSTHSNNINNHFIFPGTCAAFPSKCASNLVNKQLNGCTRVSDSLTSLQQEWRTERMDGKELVENCGLRIVADCVCAFYKDTKTRMFINNGSDILMQYKHTSHCIRKNNFLILIILIQAFFWYRETLRDFL